MKRQFQCEGCKTTVTVYDDPSDVALCGACARAEVKRLREAPSERLDC